MKPATGGKKPRSLKAAVRRVADKKTDGVLLDFLVAAQRWKDEVYDKCEEVDPNDQFVWQGVAIGFLLGCGFSIEEARKLEGKLPI